MAHHQMTLASYKQLCLQNILTNEGISHLTARIFNSHYTVTVANFKLANYTITVAKFQISETYSTDCVSLMCRDATLETLF